MKVQITKEQIVNVISYSNNNAIIIIVAFATRNDFQTIIILKPLIVKNNIQLFMSRIIMRSVDF